MRKTQVGRKREEEEKGGGEMRRRKEEEEEEKWRRRRREDEKYSHLSCLLSFSFLSLFLLPLSDSPSHLLSLDLSQERSSQCRAKQRAFR